MLRKKRKPRWNSGRRRRRLAEAKSKARKISIDFAEKLIAWGIKQNDLPRWDRIITKAGIKPEKLAKALEQYGSLEELYQHRQAEEQKLWITISELKSQVKTLTEERQKIRTDISIVRKETLAGIVNMSKKTLETMDNLAAKSEESINSQQQSAAEVIKSVGQKTQAEVEAISKKALEDMQLFVNQANRYASLEHSAGVLSQELIIARALKHQVSGVLAESAFPLDKGNAQWYCIVEPYRE